MAKRKKEPRTRPRERRNAKDSVFVDWFGRDRRAPENDLALYNALHGTSLTLEDADVQLLILEGVIYMAYANDVAFLVNGQAVILMEHQSTINGNMPLRLLDYVARLYEKVVPHADKFRRRRVPIPAPEFYVFYNGAEDYPEKSELRLSDAFAYPECVERPAEPPLELVVTVYNINAGRNKALLDRCRPLREYAELMGLVRHAYAQKMEEPLTWAVREAIRRGIMPDYLERKSTEVINMLLREYDYQEDVSVQRAEAREEGWSLGREEGWTLGREEGWSLGREEGRTQGREEGRSLGREEGLEEGLVHTARNMLGMGLSREQVARATELSMERVAELAGDVVAEPCN